MSGKRSAEVQITQFTDLDGELEGGGAAPEGGFQKADASTMARRKIVKARRKGRPVPEAPEEPKSAPTEAAFSFTPNATDTSSSSTEAAKPAWSFTPGATEAPKFDFGAGSAGDSAAPVFSFGGSGDAATPAFSFGGSASSGAAPTFSFGAPAEGGATFTFGAASPEAQKGFAEAAASAEKFDFSSTTEGEGDVSGFSSSEPLVVVEEQDVRTGEEEEERAFPPTRSKLYVMLNKEWKERGLGKVSVNVLKSDRKVTRVVFRTEQVGAVRLNASVFASMSVKKVSEKGVQLLVLEEGAPASYFVRFGKPAEADEFLKQLEEAKARLGGSAAPVAKKEEEGAEAAPRKKARVIEQPVVIPGPRLGVCVLHDASGTSVGLVTLTQKGPGEPVLVEATVKSALRGSLIVLASEGDLSKGMQRNALSRELGNLQTGPDSRHLTLAAQAQDLDVPTQCWARAILLLEGVGNEVVASGVIGVGDPQ